jgi:hypothetical protein
LIRILPISKVAPMVGAQNRLERFWTASAQCALAGPQGRRPGTVEAQSSRARQFTGFLL